MALDFPSSPTNGQTYTQNGLTYTYDSTYGVWKVNPIAVPDVFGVANAAFGKANTGYGIANSGFDKANTYVGLTPSVISANTNAAAGTYYIATGAVKLTLPGSPSVGATVGFYNYSSVLTSIIDGNSANIMSRSETLTVDKANTAFIVRYVDTNRGWVIT